MSNVSQKDFINAVVSALEVNPASVTPKKAVDAVLKAVSAVTTQHLKAGDVIIVPGLVRLKSVKKPATKAREGVNPFTKEKMMIPAKPAMIKVKALPVKALKSAVI
ncbi:MAG TPA: HU family DNA-binding protein [Methylobacter sp.]|jgi:nucleoid DNA-binding protein